MWGLLIVGSAFLAGLCISWWARGVSSPTGDVPAPPTPEGVVGYPHKVDPLATLDLARSLTKRKDLRGLSAFGVSSDGTVDVGAVGRTIRYSFSSQRGEGPQPPHPPGTLVKRVYCGKQSVHVNGGGIAADPDQAGLSCPPNTEPLPNPRCGPKQVWQAAIRHGVPTDQIANIDYFRSVAGPAWRFDQPSAPRTIVLYGDCERELTGSEALNAGP
jgi:hypothetical protein